MHSGRSVKKDVVFMIGHLQIHLGSLTSVAKHCLYIKRTNGILNRL